MENGNETGTAAQLQEQLNQWRDKAQAADRDRAEKAWAGDQDAMQEMAQREARLHHVLGHVSPLDAASDTVTETAWEMDVEGGRGPFSVNEPGVPVRVMDRLTWLGWSPEAVAEQVQHCMREDGTVSTEAMVRAVGDLIEHDSGRTIDDSEVEVLLDEVEDQAIDPFVVTEAQMQASVEDAYRTAHDGQAPPAGWAPHHGEQIEQTLTDWWGNGAWRLAEASPDEAGSDRVAVDPTQGRSVPVVEAQVEADAASQLNAGMPRMGKSVPTDGASEVMPAPFVRDPLNPTDQELQAAIQRGIERGEILEWADFQQEFAARYGLDQDELERAEPDKADARDEVACSEVGLRDEDCEVME